MRGSPAWRTFWVPLLAIALLFAGLDLHPEGEPHGPLALTGSETYFPEAAHPTLPDHVEAAHAAERPHCTACLQRLGSLGVQFEAAVSLAPPLPRVAMLPAGDPSLLRRSLRPSGARAPPLS
ncbi:MAG TPA: hypothetical protein VEL74_01025 [Thermoanaerobaculia bacterium]|nr:hypothetical protein [Thermoanaerobaculia bacterium]